MEFQQDIKAYLSREVEVIKSLDIEAINEVINELLKVREREANIYIFGNGGSAATASHYVCDFNKGVFNEMGEKRFKFHCLSDNTPIITAIANDDSYDEVFRGQLKGILKSEDLLIAVSGSGNSRNVVNAIEYGKKIGCKTIGITGYTGGKIKEMADFNLHVNVDDMQISEDVHMIFDHLMMSVIRSSKAK